MNEQTPPGYTDLPTTRGQIGSVNTVTSDGPMEPFDLPADVSEAAPLGVPAPGPTAMVQQQP